MLDPADIDRRMPVWHALHQIFLDTELDPDQYRRIAETLAASGYGRDALKAILDDEVAPAFHFNILDIAGEWTPWHPDQVREIVLDHLRGRSTLPPLPWLRRRLFRRTIDAEWEKIAGLMQAEG